VINIDQINQTGHLYFPQYRYRFPSIDFKFQNTGNATAFLWQFIVSILSREIDPTPVFGFQDFKVDVEDDALQITATNSGWGSAYDCSFHLNEPILNSLFKMSDRQYRGTIESGETRKIFRLCYSQLTPDQIELIEQKSDIITFFPLDPVTQIPYPETIRGIELRNIKCNWKCCDKIGNFYEEETQIWDWLHDFVLTSDGFRKIRGPKSGAGFPSEVTYSAIIDPTKGIHDQVYPISRKIPPGNIERFHILIGSPASCHLLIKFKFLVDMNQVIESGPFDIKIWNPRNSAWYYVYKDGEELRRDIEKGEYQTRYGKSKDIKRLEQKAQDYPFISEINLEEGK